jgi:hypothetical protein
MKTCTKCGIEKPEAEFASKGHNKKRGKCKTCLNEYLRSRRKTDETYKKRLNDSRSKLKKSEKYLAYAKEYREKESWVKIESRSYLQKVLKTKEVPSEILDIYTKNRMLKRKIKEAKKNG